MSETGRKTFSSIVTAMSFAMYGVSPSFFNCFTISASEVGAFKALDMILSPRIVI